MFDTILILIGVAIVGLYLYGIYKVCRPLVLIFDQSLLNRFLLLFSGSETQQVNEHYLMPFIVLLVLDFLGYIVSEAMQRVYAKVDGGAIGKDRWKQNLMEIGSFALPFISELHRDAF